MNISVQGIPGNEAEKDFREWIRQFFEGSYAAFWDHSKIKENALLEICHGEYPAVINVEQNKRGLFISLANGTKFQVRISQV